MSETSSAAQLWSARVAEWRASGERAETFSRGAGYAAGTLRWWASKLKRDMSPALESAKTEVRLARVIRESPRPEKTHGTAITVELPDVRARVLVEPGADRETLEMVIEALKPRVLF